MNPMADTAQKKPFPGTEVANLIQRISRLVDSGEYNGNPYDFIEARRLLNNQLPKLIDAWVAEERRQAFDLALHTTATQDKQNLTTGKCEVLRGEGDIG